MQELDELLTAMVRKLPPHGPFPPEARAAWLKMMAMAFDVTYGPEEPAIALPLRSSARETYSEEFTVGEPPKGVVAAKPGGGFEPRFYISKDGRALQDPGARPVKATEVPSHEIIYDERPLGLRDLAAIEWADGQWPVEALPSLSFN